MGHKGCPHCGKTIDAESKNCIHCDRDIHDPTLRWLCTTCGAKTNPVTLTKGSFGMEVLLWLLMILPGVLYSLWRLTSREKGCPNCRKATLIPIDSPIARTHLATLAK